MLESLTVFFENLGIVKVADQLEYLSDIPNLLFIIWETLYAPLAATFFAYVIGLPLGVLLVTGEKEGIRPLPPVLMKKIRGGMMKLQSKDAKWSDIFMTSLFLGMISAFLGMVFADIRGGIAGWIPIFVLLVSALAMAVCGLLIKKCKMQWLETYAMAISMIAAMVFAVVITPVIL